ncbi:unnamed protein product [Adineta steineri]|uniref:Uncharacterized protein n=1 Tax=Adineta steineri TaxID=433720 RepID=A0A814GTD1_9BILA|nr:unnamed protein product [Adineta steineri]CAF3978141.1 unnamed protein product [Adineta steineri]
MTSKMTSMIFVLLIILAIVTQTSSGPISAAGCYYACMTLCLAGAGLFAGIMSAGVATPAGMVYGAAACSVLCSGAGAGCGVLPLP